jgi:hypothetical protein
MINHGRRVPVGIQVVVSLREWSHSRPELVQESSEVLWIGSQLGLKFGNGDVSDLQLLSGLFFICLKYFVERLLRR